MMEDWIICRDCEHCTKPKYMVDFKGSCDVDDAIVGVCVPRICPNYIPKRDDSTCEGFIKANNDILKSKEENIMNVDDIFESYIMGGSKIFKCFEGNVEITGDTPPRVSVRQKEYNALVDIVEKLIKDISDITNDKEEVVKEKVRACIKVEELNDNISELSKKLVAFEAANKENKKLVERLDEKMYEKNEVIESLKKETKEQINKIEEVTNALIKSSAEANEANIRNKLLEDANNSLLKDNLEYLEENRKLHNILCEKEEEIDELKKQNESVFYDILDSDVLGLPHCNYLTRSNRYPIYRRNGINNMTTQDFTFVGYLYVKEEDKAVNLCSKTIGDVKEWAAGEDQIYNDNTLIVKKPSHQIAIVPMRKDGIEAAEKWVIE